MFSIEISSLERLSILTRLILEFERGLRILEAIRYAKDLAAVIDELRIFNVDLSQLQQEFISHFSEHWKRRTNFLLIVADFWPKILKELEKKDVGLTGPYHRDPEYFPANVAVDPEILQRICICESDDIFQELEFVNSIVLQNKRKRVAIISPDENSFTLLRFKLKINNIERTDNLDKSVLDEIERHFGDMIPGDDNEFRKIINELSELNTSKTKLESIDNIVLANNIGIIDQSVFDIVICTSMNEGAWYPIICGEYWLHQSIRQKIGIPTKNTLQQQMESDFYDLIRTSDEVFLTRACRINKSEARKSSILAKLEMRCREARLPINYCQKDRKCNSTTRTVSSTNSISNFIIPKRLSAGSLRLLMQNPYGFYARYSLGIESTDTNKKLSEKANAFRKLIKIYLRNESELDQHLELAKQIDFFYYQQCLSMIDWMRSNYREPLGVCDVSGYTVLGDSDVELRGSIDIIEDLGDYSSASYFQAFSPSSARELLYGADCAILDTCLIAEKNGLPEIKAPIREIKIYWPTPQSESSPFSVKILEISGNLIEDFENRVYDLLGRFSKGCGLDCSNVSDGRSSYWHLERRVK
jgi:hypothetical protein